MVHEQTETKDSFARYSLGYVGLFCFRPS